MLEVTSAIAGALRQGSHLRNGVAGVRAGEIGGWLLLQVAGFAGAMAPVEQALAGACGVPASIYMGTATGTGGVTLLRTGPEQIWAILTAGQERLAEHIRSNVQAGGGLVLDLSHSRVRLLIEGPKAHDVLAKEIALDLDPTVFPAGRFALTGFDHTPVLLHRTGQNRFELYVMRSFALTVWERLITAATEFGYEIA